MDANFKIILAGREAMAAERAAATKEGRKPDHGVIKKAQEAKRKELKAEADKEAEIARKEKMKARKAAAPKKASEK